MLTVKEQTSAEGSVEYTVHVVEIDPKGNQALSPSLKSFPLRYKALQYAEEVRKTAHYVNRDLTKVKYDI